MAVAEANYGRVDESMRYVLDIARQLDLEQPGALPEQMPSPDYVLFPFHPFPGRAMVMQAWSSYGVLYPITHCFLGIQPHMPQRLSHRGSAAAQQPTSLEHSGVADRRPNPGGDGPTLGQTVRDRSETPGSVTAWRLVTRYLPMPQLNRSR